MRTEFDHGWPTSATDHAILDFVPAKPTWLERAFAPFFGGATVAALMAASFLFGVVTGLSR